MLNLSPKEGFRRLLKLQMATQLWSNSLQWAAGIVLLPTYLSISLCLPPRTSFTTSITFLHCPGQYEVRIVKVPGRLGLLAYRVLAVTYTMKKKCFVKCDEMM